MATPVVFNAVNYSIPAFGDVGYAQGPGNLSAYLIALASGTLQPTGGLFALTSDINFGPNFGLVSKYYKTTSVNIAQSGQFRLANTDFIAWRNFANSADLPLAVNTSDQLTYNGIVISTAAAGGTVNPGVAGRLTLYPASGNTVDDIYVQNAQNIDILIAPQATRSTALQYTIPNPGDAVAAATFALLELAQTFTAAQTFAQTVTITAATNQLILGSGNTTTITSPAPAASRVYTIPDSGGATQFVMGAGNQTIGGVKTFNGGAGAITMSGSTIAMGANKITGLASATVSGDAIAQGQTGAALTSAILTTPNIGAATATSINFGGTSLANYNEGTWTPADNSGASLPISVTSATYTRIGRVVYIQMFVAYPSTANASAVNLSGLPFTVNGALEMRAVSVTNAATTGTFAARFVPNTTTLTLETTNGRIAITNANLTSAQLFVTGFYFV